MLSYDEKQKALEFIRNKKQSAPATKADAIAEIQAYKQNKIAQAREIENSKESVAEKIAGFTGGKELAQGAGQALAGGTVNKLSEESLNRGIEMQTKIINAIKQAREIGNTDVEQRLTAQLKNIDFGQGIQEGFTDDMVSNREVIGSAIQLGTTATGAFASSKAIGATKGLSPFKQILAGATAEGAVQGLGFGAGEEIKQEDATLGSVAKEGLKGAGIGAGLGLAGGAVIGGTLPAIGKVSQKLFPKGTLDEVIQKVTQKGSSELGKGSSKKLNQQVTDAIKLVDTSDVKTYNDLTKLFDDKASELTKAQDAHLSQFTDKLDNNAYTLRKTTKGGNTVVKNYVDEAFDGLEDLYVKTNDIESLTDLRALRQQADAEGLTIKEINDITRTYGREIASKAFKTDAQGITTQVSSTTPEAFEATRKGLKETIRESTPDQLSKQIDSEITDVISAKNRFAKLSDDVAQMNLKAQEVKGLGKIAKPILDLMDTLSFGFTKGALQALRKESGIAGKSYMNIVEAEKVLSKRLKNVEKLMNQANKVTDEAGVKSILDSKLFKQIFDTDGEFSKLKQTIKDTPNKQGGFVKNPLGKGDVIDSLNPTGGVFVDYTPQKRAIADLADNMTTYSKTAGIPEDEIVTIYRGTVPNQNSIAPGDFITTSKELADSYSGGKVITKKVRAGDIIDDINEPLGDEYLYIPDSYKEMFEDAKLAIDEFDDIDEALEDYIDLMQTRGISDDIDLITEVFNQAKNTN